MAGRPTSQEMIFLRWRVAHRSSRAAGDVKAQHAIWASYENVSGMPFPRLFGKDCACKQQKEDGSYLSCIQRRHFIRNPACGVRPLLLRNNILNDRSQSFLLVSSWEACYATSSLPAPHQNILGFLPSHCNSQTFTSRHQHPTRNLREYPFSS